MKKNFRLTNSLCATALVLATSGCSGQNVSDVSDLDSPLYISKSENNKNQEGAFSSPTEDVDRLAWAKENFREEAHYNRLRVVHEIADYTGYDWRSTGSSINYGCPSTTGCECSVHACHYGTISGFVDHTITKVWIFPSAFISFEQLHYIVFHEVAHIWQVQHRGWDDDYEDFFDWLPTGMDPMEATADCLAKAWGASPVVFSYWNCPPPAEEYMRKIYELSNG